MARNTIYIQTVFLTFLATLTLVSCSSRGNGAAGCLGGSNSCGDIIQNTSNTETQVDVLNPLRCTAYASPSQPAVGEAVTVQVAITNAQGSASIRNGQGQILVGSAANFATFFTQYGSEKSGQIVQETLQVSDSASRSAYCAFQLNVKQTTTPTNPTPSQLTCEITTTNPNPVVGAATTFIMRAINASGNATFSHFFGNSDWMISDSYLQTLSSTQASMTLMYQYAGAKIVSARVTDSNNTAVCSMVVTAVGGTTTPPPVSNDLACNLTLRPMGSQSTASVAALQDSLVEIIVTPANDEGKAVFIDTLSSSPEVSAAIYPTPTFPMDRFPSIGVMGDLKEVVRFRKSGSGVIQAGIRDSSGRNAVCSTNYLVKPRMLVSSSLMQGNGANPRVRSFNGNTGVMIEDFMAYDSSFTGGVAVSQGDFDYDGMLDYITIEATNGVDNVRIYKGSESDWSASKAAPMFMWTGYGGLPSDGSERRITSADFNGDGIADFAISNGCTGTSTVSPSIRVYNGATKALMANFQPTNGSGTAYKVGALASGDISLDGYADLSVISCDGTYVGTYSGAGLSSSMITKLSALTLPAIASGNLPGLGLGDLDQDGRADLMVVYTENNTAWVRAFNSVSGASLADFRTLLDGWSRIRAGTADVNGDGVADMLLAGSYASTKSGKIHVLNGASSVSTNSAQMLLGIIPFSFATGMIGIH